MHVIICGSGGLAFARPSTNFKLNKEFKSTLQFRERKSTSKNIVVHAAVFSLDSSSTTAGKRLQVFDSMVHVWRCVSDAL
ncbi:hypothetical protein MPTK1_3g02210 [Marchantia polymorpha subsp. ruderalis]|uniref:Uncharacterized protein n=2 Tax=Marchantia polymorpha TaxID=3197 RepID=A0AAF6AWM5_MARPO|nr:hypothetical protein MARPO_0007s0210 [Marchantia polymorpha]BBN04159.1 hypothetical protein Mp_3g02210 [Marchantia polymorpha subsp. ruderalis]|eukprot:PTQ47846.1 hypothetical protein MARPO_0007s0210 [Marchantia polymorpha]